MLRLAFTLLTVALATACAKQGPAHAPAPAPLPQNDACSDARLAPVCAPTAEEAPVQVDTNLRAASRTARFG